MFVCRLSWLFFILLSLSIFTANISIAEENAGPLWKKYYNHWQNVSDFIEVELPQTIGADSLEIDLRPRLRDILREDFIRLQWEITYGINDQWDVLSEWSPYIPNPVHGGSKWGLGSIEIGTKYNLLSEDVFWGDVAIGLITETPLGKPPREISSNYFQMRPFVSMSRPLFSPDQLSLLTEVEYIQEFEVPGRNYLPKDYQENILRITPALYWKHSKELQYYGKYTWSNIRRSNEAGSTNALEPGIIWSPQSRIHPKVPGSWSITLGYELEHGLRGDINHSIQIKLRWRIRFKD